MNSPPSSSQQLEFLTKLQRLFNEGDFTATYKFALIISLAELSLEREIDDEGLLLLSYRDIGRKFIEMYWQQAMPYRSMNLRDEFSGEVRENPPGTLVQNRGAQAAVITAIEKFRCGHAVETYAKALGKDGFETLLTAVSRTVADQPARFMQNLGGKHEPFLFERVAGGVSLFPGVAFCLRRFHPLVNQLARSKWVQHIRANRQNSRLFGDNDDLEQFLFSSSRRTLQRAAPHLMAISRGLCFYCGRAIGDSPDIDHFIPFSLYSRDIMQNLVVAHGHCNRSKSDTLSARLHVSKWCDYLSENSKALVLAGSEIGQSADGGVMLQVARSAYENAVFAHAQTWISSKNYEQATGGIIEDLASVVT